VEAALAPGFDSLRGVHIQEPALRRGEFQGGVVDSAGAFEEAGQALDAFSAALEAAAASSFWRSLSVASPAASETMGRIAGLTEELRLFLLRGETEGALRCGLRISAGLLRLEELSGEAAHTIQMTYFYLFCILAALFIIMAAALWLLNRALERALVREKNSAAFSRGIMLAQERERARIARELHDTAAQDLRGLALKISRLKREPQGLREFCREAAGDAEQILRRIRGICGGLAPPDFSAAGLPGVIRYYCREFGERTGIDCRVSVEAGLEYPALDAEAQLQCFRVVQEALTNIEKHSGATEAVVVLRNGGENGQTLVICVSDDGKGFENPPSKNSGGPDHMGIRGMFERIAILGGALNFISRPDEGTMVQIEVKCAK
jgi:signal transduction histidine kinase